MQECINSYNYYFRKIYFVQYRKMMILRNDASRACGNSAIHKFIVIRICLYQMEIIGGSTK